MKRLVLAVFALTASLAIAQKGAVDYRLPEQQRWAAHAHAITITRDTWGIAHVKGKTDADAVFGMIYTQCEDDFNRVETNYLVSLGRVSEADGESKLWQDLRQQLFIDPVVLKRDFDESPDWLKALMEAWADGANYYLAKHPNVKPRALTHFEPWMALSFTEGSIGGDIERVNLKNLEAFYSVGHGASIIERGSVQRLRDDRNAEREQRAAVNRDVEPGGSNGAAISPANTKDHHALLLINPHTSFFFRSELQMTSDEGLNAYGAVTWGQIFVYQGFNDRAGWMHTSSNVDAIDEFENVVGSKKGGGGFVYHYGNEFRPLRERSITLRYRTADGFMKERSFVTYFDHRGPIIREDQGKWVSIQLMNIPVKALEQSFLRTKARSYGEYRKTMELMANSSNNTIFASADGDIAYWHGNYIPERDTRFDYTKPVDGTNPATDWQGLTTLDQIPQLRNPHSGWLENVNNAPWSGAGESSLKKKDYPPYVEQGVETARGVHMVRVLNNRKDFTLDSLLTAAFDPYLPYFATTVPALLKAYDALPENDAQRTRLAPQIEVLRKWDDKWAADSIATTLAVYWGEASGTPVAAAARRSGMLWEDYVVANVSPADLLAGLQKATDKLTEDFGTWQKPWGAVNRYQRLDDSIVPHFDDAQPSIAIPFTASTWGSLAASAARSYPNTKKRYGTSGNSFVAVVEFGPDRVRARAVTCGGESGHPDSKHFNDQQDRYASGDFREVMFYPDQLRGHVERTYHPGE